MNIRNRAFFFFFLASLLFLTACGWFSAGSDHPTSPLILAPDIIQTEDGTYVYVPTTRVPGIDILDNQIEECREVKIIERSLPAMSVNDHAVGFVYKTIENEYDYGLDDDSDGEFLLNADYIHIRSAKLFVESGSTLEFVEWIKARVGSAAGPMIAWTPDPSGREAILRVDGSINLAEFLQLDSSPGFKIHSSARGKSPEDDTTVGLKFTLIAFKDCS
jgi:hypothetical protein